MTIPICDNCHGTLGQYISERNGLIIHLFMRKYVHFYQHYL